MIGTCQPTASRGDVSQYSSEVREVLVVEQAEELQVQEDELHRRVADALADAERRAVHAVGAELERPERVLEREAAVVVAVPVDADVVAPAPAMMLRVKCDEVAHAVGRGVARPCRERQRRVAPWSMAVLKSVASTSGRERVVSSVTYATGRPALTRDVDRLGAALGDERRRPTPRRSWRMGLEPMKA